MEHTLRTRVTSAAGLGAARIEALRLALLVVLVELTGVGVGAERVSGAHAHNLVLFFSRCCQKHSHNHEPDDDQKHTHEVGRH